MLSGSHVGALRLGMTLDEGRRPLSAATRATLERAFNPRVVAVIGDKRAMNYMWLRSQKTFQGKVYSVQIDERELPGIEARRLSRQR